MRHLKVLGSVVIAAGLVLGAQVLAGAEEAPVDAVETTTTTTVDAAPPAADQPVVQPEAGPAVEPPAQAAALLQTFSSCEDARAAGYSNILRGQPGYSSNLDKDNDGVACDDPGATPSAAAATPAPAAAAPVEVAGAVVVAAPPPVATQTFANCDAARAAGQTNIPAGSPAYSPELDRDKDGIACDDESSSSASTASATDTSTATGGLAQTGATSWPLAIAASIFLLIGGIAILARNRLLEIPYIVVYSKTGSVHLVRRAKRFQ